MRSERHDAFAVCPPGLEELTAGELAAMGISTGRRVRGGVSFGASTRQLYAANLWSRCATRLVIRVGRFDATNLHDFERRAGRVDLSAWLAPGDEVRVRVSSRRSPLQHTGAVAERLLEATGMRPAADDPAFPDAPPDAQPGTHPGDDHDHDHDHDDHDLFDHDGDALVADVDAPDRVPPPLLLVRISGERCTLSIDTSGEPLHRRGWRRAVAAAPLRPTLAAATLLSSGWDGTRPLADPFCGSGTICIEAALLAGNRPPGIGRGFAFHHWPSFEPGTWASVTGEADTRARPAAVTITGTDRDEGAVAAATANAQRAGVNDEVAFTVGAVSAWEAPTSGGVVVTNPPWGRRIGSGDLRNLYARLGTVVRASGWDATVVAADARLARHSGLALRSVLETRSGGQPVEVLTTVPADSDDSLPGHHS
ncbi:MAG: hypothetical protein JJU45_18140 [Acidimicrobiia bacterium]|nr:hypothetical protein [Acidimicrobiia bacterium]